MKLLMEYGIHVLWTEAYLRSGVGNGYLCTMLRTICTKILIVIIAVNAISKAYLGIQSSTRCG